MNQGWHEFINNEMLFYPCGFNIPRIVNQLSNFINAITGEKRASLNMIVALYAHNNELNKEGIENEKDEELSHISVIRLKKRIKKTIGKLSQRTGPKRKENKVK